ncbi:hypothetical protein MKZ38_005315 [Zalerion maritima]|uniref:Uncharacterized protein n=1 Tax=Zalerion maritima TaxID=339359 RepID=A0AAD5WQC0_9PEZI|nr:hypothetical protein MKZ38_005315 [Zalerion maritima]
MWKAWKWPTTRAFHEYSTLLWVQHEHGQLRHVVGGMYLLGKWVLARDASLEGKSNQNSLQRVRSQLAPPGVTSSDMVETQPKGWKTAGKAAWGGTTPPAPTVSGGVFFGSNHSQGGMILILADRQWTHDHPTRDCSVHSGLSGDKRKPTVPGVSSHAPSQPISEGGAAGVQLANQWLNMKQTRCPEKTSFSSRAGRACPIEA